MSTVSPERLVAARAFGAWMASPEGVRSFTGKKKKPSAVVVCDSEESIEDAYARFSEFTPPVMAAVYFADRERFVILGVEPVEPTGAPGASDGVGGRSTIGMLADYVTRNGAFTFKLTKGSQSLELKLPVFA